MNRRLSKIFHIEHWATAYLLLVILLSLFSWVGTIYGLPLKSLIDAEGIRWAVRNTLENFSHAPLASVITLAIGIGLLYHSGFIQQIFSSYHSVKQRRALSITFIILGIYLAVIMLMIFAPHAILLSATGEIYDSPFTDGLIFILSLGCGISGLIYGSSSGQYRTIGDIMEGMCSLLKHLPAYLVTLFLASQLIAVLEYTHTTQLFNLKEWEISLLQCILYYIPLILLFISQKRHE